MIISTTLAGPGCEGTIGKALSSVAPFVDACLVVWTGDDQAQHVRIVEAARASEAKIIWAEWRWRDDFGAARNAALDLAEAAGATWALTVDSDEWIEPRGEDMRAVILGTDAPALMMMDGGEHHYQPRAIRLPSAERWDGRVHEAITVIGPPFASARVCDHPKTPEQMQAKRERDVEALTRTIAERPNEARWLYYLGDALEGLGRLEEAVETWKRRAQLRGWEEEAAWACFRAAACLCLKLSRHEEALSAALRGLSIHPGIAELCWIASIASLRLGRPSHAVYWAEYARVQGERSTSPLRALDHRVLFRVPKGLREGPADVERFALEALGLTVQAAAAHAEFDAWGAVAR